MSWKNKIKAIREIVAAQYISREDITDIVETLLKENQRLREALEKIIDHRNNCSGDCTCPEDIAKEA